MSIKSELDKLKSPDIYTLVLFVLYKIRDIPEYRTLSELAYILNKDSLLTLCEYFGGTTIAIPTVDELESIIYSLLLYQYVEIDKMSYEEAVNKVGISSNKLRQAKKDYNRISGVLEEYIK